LKSVEGSPSKEEETPGRKGFHKSQVAAGARLMIQGLGLDLNDPNLIDTPRRVAKAYREFCAGLYNADGSLEAILGRKFPSNHDEMVFSGPIHSVGVCPHHLVPVEMSSFFAYIPTGQVVGLSKIPRFIKMLSARPVLQEDLAKEIADKFMEYVKPLGVALLVEARHGCMAHRGVHEQDTTVDTVAMRGVFREDVGMKEEFHHSVARRKRHSNGG